MSMARGDDYDDDDGILGSGAGQSSRARMLAQQRERQLRKRQSAAQAGGMVRSSVDKIGSPALSTLNSSHDRGNESQFTPAVRQFSAPKSMKDSGDRRGQNEFSRPTSTRKKPVQYDDDDDDDINDENPMYSRQSEAKSRKSTNMNSRDRRNFSDDEGNFEEDNRRQSSRVQLRTPAGGKNRGYEDDEYENEYDRRGGGDRSPLSTPQGVDSSRSSARDSARYNYRMPAPRRGYPDEEDEDPDGDYRYESRKSQGQPRKSQSQVPMYTHIMISMFNFDPQYICICMDLRLH
jgi:hypothetical protein